MAFKRINFFKGFFTKAEDWQNTETYHNEKRKLHNRGLHTPGIVYGLEVEAIKEGKAINVAKGYAIDGQGRDLFLDEGKDIEFDGSKYEPDKPIYVVMKYNEQATDERPVHGEERNEFAFIEESVNIAFATDPPDGTNAIELARFVLAPGKRALKDPRNPAQPVPNEIDRRYVKRAGARGRMRLADISQEAREGETKVVVSEDALPSERDPNVLIERIEGENRERFYLINAYPIGHARISWRLESESDGDAVEYRLYFKNFSSKSVKVAYRVLRLV
jgi:hypothetical protein